MEVARTSNRESSYVVIFQPLPCGAFLNVQNTIQKAMFMLVDDVVEIFVFYILAYFHTTLFASNCVRLYDNNR